MKWADLKGFEAGLVSVKFLTRKGHIVRPCLKKNEWYLVALIPTLRKQRRVTL